LSALAQIDSTYFSEALEAARSLQNEDSRASVLSALAQIDSADFSQLLEAARSLRDEDSRASVLSALAPHCPETFLPQVIPLIYAFHHKPTAAEVLSTYLPRLPLATFTPADWQRHLHLLARRKRADLMEDLAALYPAIVHLGGEAAMRGVVDAMREVCGQWE
jgi:hypothetical protein